MTFEAFENWVKNLDTQTLTDELKDDIIEAASNINSEDIDNDE